MSIYFSLGLLALSIGMFLVGASLSDLDKRVGEIESTNDPLINLPFCYGTSNEWFCGGRYGWVHAIPDENIIQIDLRKCKEVEYKGSDVINFYCNEKLSKEKLNE